MGYMYKGRSGDIRVSQAKRLKGAADDPQIEHSVSDCVARSDAIFWLYLPDMSSVVTIGLLAGALVL